MGLDVYVGSLTRYYVESSADVVERIARHQGMAVSDGQDAEEVIRAAVAGWRDGLSRWLGDRLDGPLDWDESGPAPCFTDKPGWDGYGGTLLLAAHDEHPELPAPAQVSADWPDDPAYQAASAPGAGSRYHQLLTQELWLPCRFAFTVRTQDITGEEVELGSSVALLDSSSCCRPATAWTASRRTRPPTATRCRPPPATAWPCSCAWPSGRSSTGCR